MTPLVSVVTALAATTILCALVYIPLRRLTFKVYLSMDGSDDSFEQKSSDESLNRKQRCIAFLAAACFAVNCFLLSALPKESSLGGWSVVATMVAAMTIALTGLHYGGEETELKYRKEHEHDQPTESPCKHKK